MLDVLDVLDRDIRSWQVLLVMTGSPVTDPGNNVSSLIQARDAVAKMIAVLREVDECAAYWSEYDVPIGIHDRIKAALAAATGESHE